MSTKEDKLKEEIVKNALYRLDESTRMIKISLEQLEEQDVWKRTGAVSNSVGNLILHLCGNIGQYVISSLGQTKDVRERDKEFSAKTGFSKAELLEMLVITVEKAKEVIKNSTVDQLLRIREVQGFTFSGVGIIVHAVEHYSYHTGQIAFWTKQLKDKDLGFYKDVDLNVSNKQ